MRADRWVLPPALAAGVFATTAASPPTLGTTRGIVVSTAGSPGVGTPLLVAVAVRDLRSEWTRGPERVGLTVFDRGGTAVGRSVFSAPRGATVALGAVAVGAPGPWRLHVVADGSSAWVSVPAAVTEVPAGPAEPWAGGIDLRVDGGAIVPELPATLRVYAPGSASVRATSEGDALTIAPPEALTDGCGVAVFRVTLHGLDAPVHIEGAGGGASRRTRLPVDAGGLMATLDAHALHVEAAAGPVEVFAAGGDSRGPTWWRVASMTSTEGGGAVDFAPPSGTTWASVARDPGFTQARTVRVLTHGTQRCTADEALVRWQAWTAAPPGVGPVQTVYDGAARVAVSARRLRRRVRWISLAFLAFAITLEGVLVVQAAFAPSHPDLAGFEGGRRGRLKVVAAALALLLIVGFVLALRVMMEAAGE